MINTGSHPHEGVMTDDETIELILLENDRISSPALEQFDSATVDKVRSGMLHEQYIKQGLTTTNEDGRKETYLLHYADRTAAPDGAARYGVK